MSVKQAMNHQYEKKRKAIESQKAIEAEIDSTDGYKSIPADKTRKYGGTDHKENHTITYVSEGEVIS